MNDQDYIKQVWPNKEVVRVLGRGSFGVVYECQEIYEGILRKSAIKIIQIPSSRDELISDIELYGLSEGPSIENYFSDKKNAIMNEIMLMEELKTSGNVVTVYDYKTIKLSESELKEAYDRQELVGYKILIEMELLKSLQDYNQEHKMDSKEIVQMGIDICRALDICHKRNIIHRDVKNSNIFVSDHGTFKIGDFGISRHLSENNSNMSQKGTENFMAPEIYYSKNYDYRVDIYSMGMVLYRMLNGGRPPFCPPTGIIGPNDVNNSQARRLSGEDLPAPANADERLGKIIVKATAFSPEDRYKDISSLRDDLVLYRMGQEPRLEDWLEKENDNNQFMEELDKTVWLQNDLKKNFKVNNHKEGKKEDAKLPDDKKAEGAGKKVSKLLSKKDLDNKDSSHTRDNKSTFIKNKKTIILSSSLLALAILLFVIIKAFSGPKDEVVNMKTSSKVFVGKGDVPLMNDDKYAEVNANSGIKMKLKVINDVTGYYIGEVDSDGLADGRGAFSSEQFGYEGTYSGQWSHGKALGFGKFIGKDKKIIIKGDFKKEQFEGFYYDYSYLDNVAIAEHGYFDYETFKIKEGYKTKINSKDGKRVESYSFGDYLAGNYTIYEKNDEKFSYKKYQSFKIVDSKENLDKPKDLNKWPNPEKIFNVKVK